MASRAPSDGPALSVVIPAYNEERALPTTLESVAAAAAMLTQRRSADVEVIVVDNNSTDRTADVARLFGARVVFEPRNNIAAARNAGARAASAPVLAFLDADNQISAALLVAVWDTMRTGQHIGGGVRHIVRANPVQLLVIADGVMGLLRRLVRLSKGMVFTTAATFRRIGGFDERYYAGELSKFVLSLWKEGRRQNTPFYNITEGSVTYSDRKLVEVGAPRVILLGLKFLLMPWKTRDRSACSYWYDPVGRTTEATPSDSPSHRSNIPGSPVTRDGHEPRERVVDGHDRELLP